MPSVKEIVRRGSEICGYRITRLRPANRFQAMEDTFTLLRKFGYSPRSVIDAGANVGAWTRAIQPIYPEAEFHLIEPQTTCLASLQELARAQSGIRLYPFAITEPGIMTVRMVGGGNNGGGTGAYVALADERGEDEAGYPATTLDQLFADRIAASDRCLLKLDLEGHELSALRGARRLLQNVEIILTEVWFYEINHNHRPIFREMLMFLHDHGFETYDFASLSQRPRDMRLRMGDVVFVRRDSPLLADCEWE